MFRPDDPDAKAPPFAEPWHAQVLAIADGLIATGHLAAPEWAASLGAELRRSEREGLPDTSETYFAAALRALERLTAARLAIDADAQARRRAEWEAAYRTTPHGRPVVLEAGRG